MEAILIPIGICVILPVLIVWLVNRTRQNETNCKTEIMLKAIEAGATIDADLFKVQQNGPRTIKERLLKRLTGGCVCTFLGIAAVVVAIIGRNMMTEFNLLEIFIFPCIAAAVFFAIGIALIIVFFVGMKMLAEEMDAEVKSL